MYNDQKEREEAILAGRQALESLYAAKRQLESARNWGIADMLSRKSMLLTFIKRNKMQEAQRYIDSARTDLKTFTRELGDIRTLDQMDIQMGDFLGFADYFFDNFFVDWMVQDQINRARNNVETAIRRVEEILQKL